MNIPVVNPSPCWRSWTPAALTQRLIDLVWTWSRPNPPHQVGMFAGSLLDYDALGDRHRH